MQRPTAMIINWTFASFLRPDLLPLPLLLLYRCFIALLQVQKVEKIVHNPVDLEASPGRCGGFGAVTLLLELPAISGLGSLRGARAVSSPAPQVCRNQHS